MAARSLATYRYGITAQVQDTFSRADSSSSLGTTEIGGLAWGQSNNNMGISGNAAYFASLVDNSYCYVDTGTSNAIAEMTIGVYGGSASKQQGLYFRIIDTNNWWRWIRATSTILLQKRVGGSNTTVATITLQSSNFANGDKFKVRLYGNTIACYFNDALLYTATDATHVNATKYGFGIASSTGNTSARYDNFSVTY